MTRPPPLSRRWASPRIRKGDGRRRPGALPPLPACAPSATTIYFLLEAHQRSHWHRVDAAEIWFWHAGSPVTLSIAASDAGPVRQRTLGADVLAGQAPQVLIPEQHWQAAALQGGWALVSCVVSPGFEFAGFELAPPDWNPGN